LINRRKLLAGGAGLGIGFAAIAALMRNTFRSPFDETSTAEEVTAGIDLTGKTALVTGCNSGIGYETMRVLALRGAHVIGTARTVEKGQEACASIEGRCTPVVLELTDFDSVVGCANQVDAMDVPLDILICNAGVLYQEHREKNGLELHFLVNHLGHFLLTRRLLNRVLAAPQGRVVILGSQAHFSVPDQGIYFDDLSGRTWKTPAYAHSKLANGLFALELARRFEGTDATSNCVGPGKVVTNIFRNAEIPWDENGKNVKSIAQGAATTCYVATSPELAAFNGYYFRDCNPSEPSALMRDTELANRLWDVSEKLVSEYL
jgi:NAD(P)-dependent dehydrogenase (short-subunit alcohol dehydrogenase family)